MTSHPSARFRLITKILAALVIILNLPLLFLTCMICTQGAPYGGGFLLVFFIPVHLFIPVAIATYTGNNSNGKMFLVNALGVICTGSVYLMF